MEKDNKDQIIPNQFWLPPSFKSRQTQENKFMAHYVWEIQDKLREWLSSVEAENSSIIDVDSLTLLLEDILEIYNSLKIRIEGKKHCWDISLPDDDNDEVQRAFGNKLRTIIGVYNYHHRLAPQNIQRENICEDEIKTKGDLEEYDVSLDVHLSAMRQLRKIQNAYKEKGLLPTPTPCEYIDDSLWSNGGASAAEKWVGHGWYWKHSDNEEVCKDVGPLDFDCIEPNLFALKRDRTNVLFADYDLLRRDFYDHLNDKTNYEINEWLLDQTAYLSEGQLGRMSCGGDMHDLLDLSPPVGKESDENPLDHIIDSTKMKSAIRLKGGGRAVSFLVDSNYSIDKETCSVVGDLIDVKGIGTTILQPEIPKKACGYLSLVDALKELAYQRLIQRLADNFHYNTQSKIETSEIDKSRKGDDHTKWGTVQFYAIIDTGIKFSKDKPNPATGYNGDRCVLSLRQAQSRFVGVHDEIVYWSVVRRNQNATAQGRYIRKILCDAGVSSEQVPRMIIHKAKLSDSIDKSIDIHNEALDAISYDLTGDWNVQCDASLTHLVDFSHWFVLPDSPLSSVWKISKEAMIDGFKLGAKYMPEVFEVKPLREDIFGKEASSSEKASKIWDEQQAALEEKYGHMGTPGKRKPDYSWSWFLEVDDSEVMKWAMREGMNFKGNALDCEILNQLEEWLPKRNKKKEK